MREFRAATKDVPDESKIRMWITDAPGPAKAGITHVEIYEDQVVLDWKKRELVHVQNTICDVCGDPGTVAIVETFSGSEGFCRSCLRRSLAMLEAHE